jgi:hypothetical protein
VCWEIGPPVGEGAMGNPAQVHRQWIHPARVRLTQSSRPIDRHTVEIAPVPGATSDAEIELPRDSGAGAWISFVRRTAPGTDLFWRFPNNAPTATASTAG